MTIEWPVRLLCVVALITAASCGGGGSASASPIGAKVEIKSFRFEPAELEIARGTAVTWTNGDAILHTVTTGSSTKKDDFGNYDLRADGRIDGSLPDQGATFTFTFSASGTYAYFCSRHNNMTARVVVR